MAQSTILSAVDLARSFGPDEIFHDVSFQISDREHVALVGTNGAGKSTLIRILAGLDTSSRGEIAVARGARVAVLAQEPRFESAHTVREEARQAFQVALEAQARMRELELAMQSADEVTLDELMAEYERLSLHFEAAGGYDVEHRTDEILSGLGFTTDQFDQPAQYLSGGQKTRLALAKVLLSDPDLLLLDEPTNHLDLGMLEWLEGFLNGWGGACIIISHDRYFLDRVTKRTLELSHGRLEDYPAPYGRFLELRAERQARRLREFEEQQEYIARTEDFIRRYKAGQRSREARGRQTRLDRLERIERPQEHPDLNLKPHVSVRSGREVITSTPLRVGYGGENQEHVLLTTPELRVERGDRVAIVGNNGSGKSTLLKTIVGQLPSLKGRVTFGTNVKMGYYAQGHEGLPFDAAPISILLASQPMGDEAARNYLARFLFRGDEVLRPVSALSGGERSRLALACLLVEGSNLLILDEPTNHLDIQSRETLEEMLVAYDGTVVFVSHDRFFIDRVSTRVWEIAETSMSQYLGNYSDMARQKARTAKASTLEKREEPPVLAASQEEQAPPPRRVAVSEQRLQKQLIQIEQAVGRLEGRLNELSDSIAIASVDSDLGRLESLGQAYAAAQEELDEAYARWEEIHGQLEPLALVGATH